MDYLPFFLNFKECPALVVGAGAVAQRKARRLLDGGMVLTVVAAEVPQAMRELAARRPCTIKERAFNDRDVEGMTLVVAATDDRSCNRRIAGLCKAASVRVNVADAPCEGDLLFPSLISRPPLHIAVSTGGASPLLSRLLKAHLDGCTPPAYADLAELVSRYRPQVRRRFPELDERKRFWDRVLRGRVADQVFAGRIGEAERMLATMLSGGEDVETVGEVYLVGAGPGDPDLLTVKALRLMQQADVVIYDRLVSDPILKLLRDDVEKIYAGKERAKHAMPQEQINVLLLEFARRGRKVLRLKGGDPFVFGRGGEEIAMLMQQGIPFQVVPGITAALGCAAYGGIPLTHRDHAQACIFVTGHLKDGTLKLDWEMLARPGQTLVFYMGLLGLEQICAQLVHHGLPATTPAALITRGTSPEQRVLLGDLSNLASLVRDHDVAPPTLVIVGDVVSLHEKLQWYRPEQDVAAG